MEFRAFAPSTIHATGFSQWLMTGFNERRIHSAFGRANLQVSLRFRNWKAHLPMRRKIFRQCRSTALQKNYSLLAIHSVSYDAFAGQVEKPQDNPEGQGGRPADDEPIGERAEFVESPIAAVAQNRRFERPPDENGEPVSVNGPTIPSNETQRVQREANKSQPQLNQQPASQRSNDQPPPVMRCQRAGGRQVLGDEICRVQ
jgi:hypothetical protein